METEWRWECTLLSPVTSSRARHPLQCNVAQSSGLTFEPCVLTPVLLLELVLELALLLLLLPPLTFLGTLPIFQPQDLNVLTTLGVTAAVSGTRIKIKHL